MAEAWRDAEERVAEMAKKAGRPDELRRGGWYRAVGQQRLLAPAERGEVLDSCLYTAPGSTPAAAVPGPPGWWVRTTRWAWRWRSMPRSASRISSCPDTPYLREAARVGDHLLPRLRATWPRFPAKKMPAAREPIPRRASLHQSSTTTTCLSVNGWPIDQLGFAPVRPDRHVPDHRDPVQRPLQVKVLDVGRCEVRGGPVVPDGDAARLPAEPHGVLGAGDLGVQQVQDHLGLPAGHVHDVAGEPGVHEQSLRAGGRVYPHHLVDRDQQVVLDPLAQLLRALIPTARAARAAARPVFSARSPSTNSPCTTGRGPRRRPAGSSTGCRRRRRARRPRAGIEMAAWVHRARHVRVPAVEVAVLAAYLLAEVRAIALGEPVRVDRVDLPAYPSGGASSCGCA